MKDYYQEDSAADIILEVGAVRGAKHDYLSHIHTHTYFQQPVKILPRTSFPKKTNIKDKERKKIHRHIVCAPMRGGLLCVMRGCLRCACAVFHILIKKDKLSR